MAHHGFHYSDLAETEVTESKVLKIKFRIYLKTPNGTSSTVSPRISRNAPKKVETHESKKEEPQNQNEIAISGRTQKCQNTFLQN